MNSTAEENIKMEKQLAKLSCPFTWGMEELIDCKESLLTQLEYKDEEITDLPPRQFIFNLMMLYELTKKPDLAKTTKKLEECEENLADLKKEKANEFRDNMKPLEHILEATKCHLFHETNRVEEVKKILENICDVSKMNQVELGILTGCQSLAWSEYYRPVKTIDLAKRAVQLSPNIFIWHHILGKNLRRSRRKSSIALRPTDEETLAYVNAFELSKNLTMAINLAQLYREANKKKEAAKMYQKALELGPTSYQLLLKLALGFIRTKDPNRARICLDLVAKQAPDSSQYLHYRAIYVEKYDRDYKAALKYYQQAVDLDNFAAECHYILCREKVEHAFDALPYLLNCLEKYKDHARTNIQQIHLHIGTCYYWKKNDFLNACKYYVQAIEIDPQNKTLKSYLDCFRPNLDYFRPNLDYFAPINIYDRLTGDILEDLLKKRDTLDKESIDMIDKAKILCKESCEQDLGESLGKLKL